ncbi:uncharacterized, partial [Tachysurus ichikawai]
MVITERLNDDLAHDKRTADDVTGIGRNAADDGKE